MEKQLQVGVISSTHGIRGEVKVFPTTNDAARFKQLKKVYLDTGREQRLLEIESVKFFKQFAILKFKGINTINDIEKYKGRSLLVDREDAVELEEDEYYIADMIGMEVYTEDGVSFGTLREEHGEVLVPAIRACIRKVDIAAGRMEIHLMEGLIS